MTIAPTTAAPSVISPTVRSALSAGARPPRPGPLSASLTFGWRALLKIRNAPEQLGDVIALPIIFTLMFTYLFGGALSGSTHQYLQFLLPGTLVMAVVLATMYTGINLNTDIGKGVYDRFRTLPIWPAAPIAGAMLGDTLRYLLSSTLVIALGLLLGFCPHGGVPGVLLAVILVVVFALSLSWIWTMLGLVMRSPNAITSTASVILFPLTLASNTFVDPHTMPGWLHAVVNVNPITHLVTATRGAMDGTATTGQISWVLLASAVLVAVFAPLTMRLYHHKQ